MLPGTGKAPSVCFLRLTTATVRQDGKLSPADRTKAAAHYTPRAIDLITKAKVAGFLETAANLAYMKTATDLEPLRHRDDFKKLLAVWERKPNVPAK